MKLTSQDVLLPAVVLVLCLLFFPSCSKRTEVVVPEVPPRAVVVETGAMRAAVGRVGVAADEIYATTAHARAANAAAVASAARLGETLRRLLPGLMGAGLAEGDAAQVERELVDLGKSLEAVRAALVKSEDSNAWLRREMRLLQEELVAVSEAAARNKAQAEEAERYGSQVRGAAVAAVKSAATARDGLLAAEGKVKFWRWVSLGLGILILLGLLLARLRIF